MKAESSLLPSLEKANVYTAYPHLHTYLHIRVWVGMSVEGYGVEKEPWGGEAISLCYQRFSHDEDYKLG